MNEIAWVFLAVALLVIPLFSYCIARRYADAEQRSSLVTVVTTSALALSLLTLFLVPVDIYTVSANTNADGTQKDADATEQAGQALKVLYYILYGSLLAFAFAIMPFAYFWFEEEDEDESTGRRICGALKYTLAFLIIFAVLIALGVILKGGHFDPKNEQDESFSDKLKGSFSAGDSIITFSVCCLACLGLFGWIAYAAYGMAELPIGLIRSHYTANEAHTRVAEPSEPLIPSQSRASTHDLELRKTQAEIEFLNKRQQTASRWTAEDQRHLDKLKATERRLQSSLLRSLHRASQALDQSAACCARCCGSMWNACRPLRIVLGIALLCVSLLIVVSYMMSTIDKQMHSPCTTACGYTLEAPSVHNPVDLALKTFSKAFPIDYLAFGGINIYMFLAGITGVVVLGVRLLCWKLYEVQPGKSMPHGLLMGTWLLMFMVLLMNMQLITLAPQYVTFGNQHFYASVNVTTGNTTTIELDDRPCQISVATTKELCVMTQVAQFINSAQLALPFFGVIFYYANYAFFATFVVSLFVAALRKREKAPDLFAERMDSPEF